MKKTFKLVALLLVLCMVFTAVLAACKQDCGDGKHTDADHDGVCEVCGKTGLSVTHTGGTADCQHKAVCTVCGKEYGEFGNHQFSSEATCKEIVKCTVCGEEGQFVPHVDRNRDNLCDVCGTVTSTSTYTYNTYASSFPNYWNVLDYQTSDANDMMSFASSGFYEFDFAFDADGNIIDGQFSIKPVMASGLPVDVTDQYVGEEWGIQAGTKERAWKIPLRNDLCWDDGTPITPQSFIYSMQMQLDPQFKNYRADSYYNSTTVIHNAKDYYYQGEVGWYAADTPYTVYDPETLDSLIIFTLGNSTDNSAFGGAQASFRSAFGFPEAYDASLVARYLQAYYIPDLDLTVVAEMQGKTMSEIKANDAYWAEWEKIIGFWQTDPDEELDFFVTEFTWPEVDFSTVGIQVAKGENAIIVILDTSLSWGENGYHFAYDFGLPLVKEDVYEANIHEPAAGSTKWTSTYGTSVETSPSFGPYKLTVFEAGKQYVFERNTNWWGYQMEEFDNQYQTSKIVCDLIENWDTAWMAFQKGELAAVSIDVKIANDYKTSSQAYFTPSDFVQSLQIQSEAEVLTNPNDGNAKELLLNSKFRKAISLGFDRATYAATCTTSSQAGFGLFNSMHYYDVENGLRFRDTDIAKQTICEVYGVDVSEYPSLEDAYEAVTGYNLALAKQLVAEAIAEELAAGTIKNTDKLELTLGSSVDNEAQRRTTTFFENCLKAILAGTQFDTTGFTLNFDGTHGDDFAVDFRAGQYEFLFAGWSGAAWNPFYFLSAYIDPDYRYATGWTPENIELTITVNEFVFNADADDPHTITLGVLDWLSCINGYSDGSFNMGEGVATMEDRLIVAGALEQCVLESYYSIPVAYSFSAALRSYKIKAVTNNYNTFMGWGGIQYYTYNYDDAAWAAFVQAQGGTLDYKG